jgi:glycine/D-amino acid oxidase-like deaminating enzyme
MVIPFTWNGRTVLARSGDTIAAALWRRRVLALGVSRKRHRPLGISGAFLQGALVQVDGRPRPKVSLACDLPVMTATARAYRDMFPRFGQLRILRHWAGMIHATPDFGPLIGTHPSLENLWITAGWSYGFAAAPATGELLARAIHTGALDHRLVPFAVDRFDRNAPVRETGIVLAPSS